MGVMDKMRKSTGVILWVLIFSFGLLWMLADTNFFDVIQRGPNSLGAVNDEKISLDDYNQRVQYFTQQYTEQTGNSMNPELRSQYEQRAWDALVNSRLIQQKMDDLGIAVTDQEVVDMITGDNPVPFIKQQFQQEDGTINRDALRQAINSKRNTRMWIQIEQQLRQQRRQKKMQNYMQSAMQISNYEVEQAYIQRNSRADISYVRFPYAGVSEESISVTDADLRDYYNSHQKKYERNESYRFEYVSFDKSPTKEDTARTLDQIKKRRSDFASAENDSLFLNRYQSTTDYSLKDVAKDDLRDIYKPVLDIEEGAVTEVIKNQGRMYLLKKHGEGSGNVQFVVFSQDVKADPVATIDKRARTADDFSYYAQQDGFDAEVEQRSVSTKEAFATKGNNFVSGIGQSRQLLTFLKSADVGKVSKPLELPGQFVVVHVTEITPKGTRPFDEVKKQIRTVVTNNKRKQQAADHANELAQKHTGLDAIAKDAGKEVAKAQSLTMENPEIKGAGREPGVVGAVFGLQENKRSNAIKGTSAAFIVRVDKLQKAKVENLTPELRSQIRSQLKRQKNQVFTSTWIEQLKEEADIDDNRAQLLNR